MSCWGRSSRRRSCCGRCAVSVQSMEVSKYSCATVAVCGYRCRRQGPGDVGTPVFSTYPTTKLEITVNGWKWENRFHSLVLEPMHTISPGAKAALFHRTPERTLQRLEGSAMRAFFYVITTSIPPAWRTLKHFKGSALTSFLLCYNNLTAFSTPKARAFVADA